MKVSRRSVALACAVAASLSVGALCRPALAHGPDQVVQETFVFVDAGRITIEYHSTYGAILARVKLISADKDRDGVLSAGEKSALLDASAADVLAKLRVSIDGAALEMRYAEGRLVAPPLRKLQDAATVLLKFEGRIGQRDAGPLLLRVVDGNFSGATLGHMTFFVRPGPETRSLDVSRDSRTLEWKFLPLVGPVRVSGHEGTAKHHATDHNVGDWQSEGGTLAGFIQSGKYTIGFLVVALLVAAGLGAVHALSPGHGKAMVAAYLIGSKGRVRDAVILGGVVTFTHVISVVILGVLALALTEYLAPEKIYPWLGFASGCLIFVIGYWLLARKALGLGHGHSHTHPHGHSHDHAHAAHAPAAAEMESHQHLEVRPKGDAHDRADGHAQEHSHADGHTHDHADGHEHSHADGHTHDHAHGHDHSHADGHTHDHADGHAHDHDHGHDHDHEHGDDHHHNDHDHNHENDHDHGHSHVPEGEVTIWSLLSLGISGGMVPCPSALVVLLAAVAMHRIVFGLTLILAFSVGLAAVLILIGVLAVTASRFMARSTAEGRWVKVLPVVSAGIVMLVGISIAFTALLSGGVVSASF